MAHHEARWVRAAFMADFAGQRRLVCTVEGVEILLCYSGNDIVALQDKCTHLGKPLRDGRIMGGTITCSFHGACFNLKTGQSVAGPAVFPLRIFPVRIEAPAILLDMAAMS